ncbi:MAG: LuxR family transcriptional regulator [Lutibacter sp.]
MKIKRVIIFILLSVFVAKSFAQEIPPIINFSSKDYQAENQNWAIDQDKNDFIYVANNKGLLKYNGASWQLFPSPNQSIIRSVKVIGNKIYTGCYMEFGYWDADNFGKLQYHSLSNTIKNKILEDEQFWNIINFEEYILFKSLNRIYIYNAKNKTFKIIDSKKIITNKFFKVNNEFFYQKLNEGLFKIVNGKEVLVSDNPILKSNVLVNIFDFDNGLLLLTQNNGFYQLVENKIFLWDKNINNWLKKNSTYSCLKLADGTFIIGTISNGLIRMDKNGELVSNLNQKWGLQNNTVLNLFEDHDHNVWLALDNGITVINYKSPFRVFNDLQGKIGSVYAAIVFNKTIYLGTNQGLFYKPLNQKSAFKFVENTNGQVWCLKVFDGQLFCGHNNGTYIVSKKNKAKLISSLMGAWDIKPIPNHPNLLMQGNYDGMSILEKRNNKWVFRNKLLNYKISSRFFDFISDNEVVISHEYKGVYRVKLDENFKRVTSYQIDKTIAQGLKSSLVTYNNKLLYVYKNGLFRFSKTQNRFVKDSVLSKIMLKNDAYFSGKLIEDKKTNTLWGFTKKSIFYFSKGKLNNNLKIVKIAVPFNLRKSVVGYESITNISDNKFLIGTANGYVIFDLDKMDKKDFSIAISTIENSTVKGNEKLVNLYKKGIFKSNQNNFTISYAVPYYEKFKGIQYQYRLKGFYDKWSDWSSESSVTFKNLPFNENYEFNVRATIGSQITDNIASYKFSILRPWYLNNLMITIYVLLFIFILITIHYYNKRYYKKKSKKLAEEQQHQFDLAKLENEKVIMKLRNDTLRQQIESKTRELSSSTLSIVKKNEILGSIKNELLKVDDLSKIKKVITKINKHLNHKDDWVSFQKAFNNADNDFLKKVKEKHPNLTNNDLRLCAYLRLNLSSKAIAPLLNISPRSVEIKRYRLRKKMELPHNLGLVAYILDI